jgi:hypothetical protein
MKIKKKGIATLTKIWAIIRMSAVVTLWWNPFWGFVINIALDAVDGDIFYSLGTKRDWYQHFDKKMDWWFYLWLLFYCYLFFRNEKVFLWMLFFVVFRFVGELMYEISNNENILFYFPQVFTWIFVERILFPVFTEKYLYISIVLIVTICLIKEWFLHVADFPVGATILKLFGIKERYPQGR